VASEMNESPTPSARRPDPARFYRSRQRFSLSLLLFVVIIGLPIVGVPSLRNRLSIRVMALEAAIAGVRVPPTVEVGANREPLPAEYARPEPVVPQPPVLPSLERIFTRDKAPAASGGLSNMVILDKPSRNTTKILESAVKAASEAGEVQPEVSEVKYQRGKAEQDAYDLLLKSSPAVAEMVQGRTPALKFKSWDASDRGEDTFWVRLKFQSEGSAEAEYIWVVKLQSNQVSPLNFNARSIS
jgi:hypothetical protein